VLARRKIAPNLRAAEGLLTDDPDSLWRHDAAASFINRSARACFAGKLPLRAALISCGSFQDNGISKGSYFTGASPRGGVLSSRRCRGRERPNRAKIWLNTLWDFSCSGVADPQVTGEDIFSKMNAGMV